MDSVSSRTIERKVKEEYKIDLRKEETAKEEEVPCSKRLNPCYLYKLYDE